MDAEFQAIMRIFWVLRKLEPHAQVRVIDYVSEVTREAQRFRATTKAATKTSGQPGARLTGPGERIP